MSIRQFVMRSVETEYELEKKTAMTGTQMMRGVKIPAEVLERVGSVIYL